MASVTDSRVYRGISWPSDHRLVGLTLRLSLAAHKPQLIRRSWDTTRLSEQPCRDSFCLQLLNRFEALAEPDDANTADSQAEYQAFQSAVAAAARSCLQPAPGSSKRMARDNFPISHHTRALLAAAQKAHHQALSSKSTQARKHSKAIRRQADTAVQRDRQRYVTAQAAEAALMREQRNMRGFAQAAKRLAGRQRRSNIPSSMQRADGTMLYGQHAAEQGFTSYFGALLGGQVELSSEVDGS